MFNKDLLKERIKELEMLLPKLREYEKNFQIIEEEMALQNSRLFYQIAWELHQTLTPLEKGSYPELLDLFNHYERFSIHKLDQSARTMGDSTWNLSTSWTLVIDTPIGTFGVYTLGRAILAEFKELALRLLL